MTDTPYPTVSLIWEIFDYTQVYLRIQKKQKTLVKVNVGLIPRIITGRTERRVTFPSTEHQFPLASTKLYCLVREQLAQSLHMKWNGRQSNLLIAIPTPQPLHLHHQWQDWWCYLVSFTCLLATDISPVITAFQFTYLPNAIIYYYLRWRQSRE